MPKDFPFIINEFTKTRGSPRLFNIRCGKCKTLIFIYQKDGPGPLKRSYLDRIHKSMVELNNQTIIKCPSCSRKLGCLDVYEKENRHAIYWFTDCIEQQDFL